MAFTPMIMREQAVRLYGSGHYTLTEIAIHFDCAERSVLRWCRAAGVRPAPEGQRPPKEDLPDVISLLRQSMELPEEIPLAKGRFASAQEATENLLSCMRVDTLPWGIPLVSRWATGAGLTVDQAVKHLLCLCERQQIRKMPYDGISQWVAIPVARRSRRAVAPENAPGPRPEARQPAAIVRPAPEQSAAA